jgi:hypothetical protein
MSMYSGPSVSATGSWLMDAVKNNPEGLLLLAAGAALLLRSGNGSTRTTAMRASGGGEGPQRGRAGQNRRMGEGLSEAAQAGTEYVSELGERVMETASSYVSSAASYAEDMARAATEQSGRLAQQARSTLQDSVGRAVQAQPLAVALAGLAAGAAVAAALPTTELETQTLGATGERLRDAAGKAGEHLKEAAVKAGQRLAGAADERGLNTEGLKEVARDVGSAFSTALEEEADQNSQARSRTGSRMGQPTANQRDPGKKRGAH